jgi:hypothetical protein
MIVRIITNGMAIAHHCHLEILYPNKCGIIALIIPFISGDQLNNFLIFIIKKVWVGFKIVLVPKPHNAFGRHSHQP